MGVYTKIKVVSFTNTYAISNSSSPSTSHLDDEGAVLKNCSGLSASGCMAYPGPTAYLNATNIYHVGNGTYSRTHSPNVTFAYSTTAATWGYWVVDGPAWYERFVYQFISGQIASG